MKWGSTSIRKVGTSADIKKNEPLWQTAELLPRKEQNSVNSLVGIWRPLVTIQIIYTSKSNCAAKRFRSICSWCLTLETNTGRCINVSLISLSCMILDGVHSTSWVQLRSYLEEKVTFPVWKTEITAVRIRYADHVAPSIHKSWH
jgi:hypothetical protein